MQSERLRTVEGRLNFQARLRAKWNMVEHSDGDVERIWENSREVT